MYGENPATAFLRNASMEYVAQDQETVKPLVENQQGEPLVNEMRGQK